MARKALRSSIRNINNAKNTMTKRKNNYFAVLLKVCVAVLLISLFYKSTDWRIIFSCVTSVKISIWLILMCCVSFETVMKTIRWKNYCPSTHSANFL